MMRRLLIPIVVLSLVHAGCGRNITNPDGNPDPDAIPKGTVVAQGPNGLYLIETDGSNLRPLRTGIATDDMAPQWSPSGTEVVYHEHIASTLQVVSLNGQSRAQNAGIAGISEQYWAEYTADGNWIYFQAWRNASGRFQIWRIRPNGTGAERVSNAAEIRSAEAPSPSPNGQEVAYTLRSAGFEVVIQNLATGQIRSLGNGFGVRWSPDGARLAFVDGTALVVARTDGSERRVLNGTTPYRTGLDWSADSRWLVARQDLEVGSIDLVRIDGSRVVAVPNTQALRQPSLLNR